MQLGLHGLTGQGTPGQRTPSNTATYPGATPMDVGRCWLTLRGPRNLGPLEEGSRYQWNTRIHVGAILSASLGVGGLLVGRAKEG